jgi:amidase
MHQDLRKKRGVDVILCPIYVGAAAEYETTHYWLYTSIWKLLELLGVIFPSGFRVGLVLDRNDPDGTGGKGLIRRNS